MMVAMCENQRTTTKKAKLITLLRQKSIWVCKLQVIRFKKCLRRLLVQSQKKNFEINYVGRLKLAKKYGEERLYRIARETSA